MTTIRTTTMMRTMKNLIIGMIMTTTTAQESEDFTDLILDSDLIMYVS